MKEYGGREKFGVGQGILWGILLLFLSCSRETVEEVKISQDKVTYSVLEYELLELINIYRLDHRLPVLAKLDLISTQAMLHNEHMIKLKEVCHHNFGNRYKLLAEQVEAKAMGENVGYGYRTSEAFLNAWLESPHHRNIILGNHTHFGISAKPAGGNIYLTLIFIRK